MTRDKLAILPLRHHRVDVDELQAPRTIKPFGPKATRFIRRHPSRDALVNILNGAVRSSKTWAVIVKLLTWMAYGWWPGGIGLITGASKTTIRTNMLNFMFEWIGDDLYSYNSQSGQLLLFGHPFLVCGASDERSYKFIKGSTVGVWLGDEVTETPESFFNMAVSRLSLPDSVAWLTTNPASPLHYLKDEWIDDEDKIAKGDVWSETYTLDDNPNIDEDKKEQLKRSFTGVFWQRNIAGLWVVAEGAIYRDVMSPANLYNDTTRPIGLHSPGGHVARYVPIDVGTVNAMAMLDVYDDGEVLWVDDEYYWDSQVENRQKTNGEYADDFQAKFCIEGQERTWPTSVIVDPSAASFKVELLARGIATQDAVNDVLEGIRRVSAMLARRLIRIHERCKNLRRELEIYAWDEAKTKIGVELPVKSNDHACDALRYLIATRVNVWRIAA